MDNFTPVAKGRFIYFFTQIQNILIEAGHSENPGLMIYSKDMRTPLFMLEALSRLYKNIYDSKKIKKLNKVFKDIEDFLGQIDYYDGFYKEWVNQNKIPQLITEFLKEKRDKKIKEFNKHLKKEKWIGKNKDRVHKILKKLDSIEWLEEKQDSMAVSEVFKNQIKKVNKKYKAPEKEFTDIETDVHELRRQLRWLSIYAQALRGLIQLKPDTEKPVFLDKYFTPEIVNSPFNKMPDGSGLHYHILLDQNYYFALSWMIAELGKLKDSGLTVELFENSISSVYKAKKNIPQLASSISDENPPTISQIVKQAQSLSNTFFREDILGHLFISDGIS